MNSGYQFIGENMFNWLKRLFGKKEAHKEAFRTDSYSYGYTGNKATRVPVRPNNNLDDYPLTGSKNSWKPSGYFDNLSEPEIALMIAMDNNTTTSYDHTVTPHAQVESGGPNIFERATDTVRDVVTHIPSPQDASDSLVSTLNNTSDAMANFGDHSISHSDTGSGGGYGGYSDSSPSYDSGSSSSYDSGSSSVDTGSSSFD
jgi:hypothetical protein